MSDEWLIKWKLSQAKTHESTTAPIDSVGKVGTHGTYG